MDTAEVIERAAMVHLEEIDQATAPGDSDVQRFYSNSTIFITGASGFLGKQLVEKLFRSCNIKKIFILLRAKKEMSIQKRLKEILMDPVFESVKKLKPDIADRIVVVEGDISQNKLGMTYQDWKMITEEVNIIFHVAATTRFNENIRDATFINVRGTREALQVGVASKQLRSFVHISTAYSHATSKTKGGEVLEQFHESPLSPDTLIKMAENIPRNCLDEITAALIEGWPNTYTFTKAVAEEQVRQMASELPVCIVRPSIVISSYREPRPAWLDLSCSFSASGFIVGSGLGLNHVVQTVKETDMSLVPVDFVNNAAIAAGWEVGTRQRDGERETVIYNMVRSKQNVILFGKLEEHMKEAGDLCPTPLAIWKSFVISSSSYKMYLLLILFLHFIPALFLDGFLFVTGNPPRFIQLFKKIHKLSISLSYFMKTLHKMDDRNLVTLNQKLSETDRKIFNFDMSRLDWSEMVKLWCIGVRKYILKDGLKETEKARKKQFWFGILNYFALALYLYVFWKIFSVFCVIFKCLY